jgi:formylglycine-generating enzyme required for sulfatase activity
VRGRSYAYPSGDSPQGANCRGDCGGDGQSHRPTGQGRPGVNGLFDMGGNAWEWVDQGSDADRRTRGGSWWYGAAQMRADHLQGKPAQTAVVYIGFRCARDYVT